MDSKLPLFNWSLNKLLATEADTFNKSRIKILYTVLIITMIKIFVVLPYAYANDQTFQFWRAFILLIVYGVFFKMLLYDKAYVRVITHSGIVGGIILIWTNIFLTAHSVNLITTQMVFIITLSSFYLLDNRWGVIYSFICSAPVIVYLIVVGKNPMMGTDSIVYGELVSPAYEIIVILNFMTISLGHYLFQQAFNTNIAEKNVLNTELQQAVDQANISAQSKSYFLSTMSHELRTPLNSVIGMTELLMDEPQTAEQKENLKILSFSALSLHSLINDILDYNKIDSDKLYLESIRVNMNDLMQSVCAGLRYQANEKGLNLILNIDDSIVGKNMITDPTRITQIIYNLAGNAIKFTKEGIVTVSLRVLTENSENIRIRFSIMDTGIGISTDKHEEIFEPFSQASRDITRNFGGTGLGLAIVKRLLDLFNSSINLESKINEGSNFYFDISFKLDNEPASENETDLESFSELSGLRVLVAEDNPINVLLLKKIFSKWDIKPVVAENGVDVVERLSEGDYDVILMDIHMPVMDGYQATRKIRNMADPEKSKIPIIALTASVSNLDQKIKTVGMNDYIYKPFNSKELYNKLKRIVVVQ